MEEADPSPPPQNQTSAVQNLATPVISASQLDSQVGDIIEQYRHEMQPSYTLTGVIGQQEDRDEEDLDEDELEKDIKAIEDLSQLDGYAANGGSVGLAMTSDGASVLESHAFGT